MLLPQWGSLLPEICCLCFYGGKDWQSPQYFRSGGVRSKPPRIPAAIFSSMCYPGCSCFLVFSCYHGEGAAALSLDSLIVLLKTVTSEPYLSCWLSE